MASVPSLEWDDCHVTTAQEGDHPPAVEQQAHDDEGKEVQAGTGSSRAEVEQQQAAGAAAPCWAARDYLEHKLNSAVSKVMP